MTTVFEGTVEDERRRGRKRLKLAHDVKIRGCKRTTKVKTCDRSS